jgi:hypothetical protein
MKMILSDMYDISMFMSVAKVAQKHTAKVHVIYTQ